MKYSLSNIIKDLLAKIPVLENRINTLSTQITNININTEVSNRQAADKALQSRLDGNEFVKSKNGENNIALKYEQKDGEDKKTLHAYVDGTEVPLGSQGNNIGIPDYSKTISVTLLPVDSNMDVPTYVIPNDGWIVWTQETVGDGVSSYHPISYFINGAQFYDTPIPVKKGDVITANNPIRHFAEMEFAPNR